MISLINTYFKQHNRLRRWATVLFASFISALLLTGTIWYSNPGFSSAQVRSNESKQTIPFVQNEFAPVLDIVPDNNGTDLIIIASGVEQVGGTVFLNIGGGNHKRSYSMRYNQGYRATATDFTAAQDISGQMNFTTTQSVVTQDVEYARAYVLPSVPEGDIVVGDLTLSLVSTATLDTEAYIAAVRSYAPPALAPAGHRLVSATYSVRASGARATSDKSMNLRLRYHDEALGGAAPETLAIFVWNTTAQRWDNLGGQLNENQKYLTVTTNHFATYALMTTPQAVVRAEVATLEQGQTITVPVELLNIATRGVGAATIGIRYNPSVLKVTACNMPQSPTQLDGRECSTAFEQDGTDPDEVRFSIISNYGILNDRTLAEISFQAIGQVGDSSALDVVVETIADSAGNELVVGDQDGQIEIVKSGQLGDVNCSDQSDVTDGLLVLKYTVGLLSADNICPSQSEPGWLFLPMCDVNEDTQCNVVDALFIMQCDVGISNILCPAVSSSSLSSSGSLRDISIADLPTSKPDNFYADTAPITSEHPVTVTVRAVDVPADGLGAAKLEVQYDPAILANPVCQVNQDDFFGICNPNFEQDGSAPDAIRFNLASTTGVTGDFPMADIVFERIGGSTEEGGLNVEILLASDPNTIPISLTVETELDEGPPVCLSCEILLPFVLR